MKNSNKTYILTKYATKVSIGIIFIFISALSLIFGCPIDWDINTLALTVVTVCVIVITVFIATFISTIDHNK